MTQVGFSSFLVATLLVPVVTLIFHRWTKARALPPILLMGSLAFGIAGASAGFYDGQKFAVDVSQVASFSFALSVDRFSAFFLFLVCSVSVPVIQIGRDVCSSDLGSTMGKSSPLMFRKWHRSPSH